MFFSTKTMVSLLGLTLAPFCLSAQICGLVQDENGQPLVGATIELQGSLLALSADAQGRYCFKALPPEAKQLKISFIGYAPRVVELSEGITDLPPIQLQRSAVELDAYSVYASRANEDIPMAFTNLSKEELAKNNLGIDLPMLLELTPSVVSTSDAGGGIGYTGLRIRGSDGTRINVTINGIPLNDAESHGVFWVNMPDFASSVQNVQIQRGVGTSTQGAGAFGASINLQTNSVNALPYVEISNSIGSFNSRKHTLCTGTGLIDGRWSADVRLSRIASDGFIDRAKSDLRSFYASAAYLGKKNLLRLNVFSGKEITYQAWGGVPVQWIDSLPTYNPYTYDNEVDDYQQTHYQLHYTHELSRAWTLNTALHYTQGRGFFEQFRKEDRLSRYGLAPVIFGTDTVLRSDLIRRRWLDNHFFGAVYALHYQAKGMRAVLGGGVNRYLGKHFGEVIWARFASNGEIRHRYYDNDADKVDANTYLKLNQQWGNFNAFLDLQHRFVRYAFLGYNNDLENIEQDAQYHFFNPKLGLSYQLAASQRLYASFAVAHREPNRDDFTQSTPSSRPKPERLYDLEAGYEGQSNRWVWAANLYYMYYQDQLVLTGQLNDVGAYIRSNVPQSYRLGLELQAKGRLYDNLFWMGNASLSQNKILAFTEYLDNWDTGAQVAVEHKNTDLAFSPSLILNSELSYIWKLKPDVHELEGAWISRYVGKQYLDNTGSDLRSLPGYWVNDFRLSYRFKKAWLKNLQLNFLLRNAFGTAYSNNGWTYRFVSEGYDPRPDDPYATAGERLGWYQQIGLYPQARRNFLLGLSLFF